jgi:hypothetical protein
VTYAAAVFGFVSNVHASSQDTDFLAVDEQTGSNPKVKVADNRGVEIL